MTYPIKFSQSRRDREELTPEEDEVAEAMKAAGYEIMDVYTDEDPFTLFTPLAALHDEYLNYTFNLREREWGVTNLSKQQFGIALRRVFGVDLWHQADQESFSGRRRINKKRTIGVYCLKGPETVRLTAERGRRPKDHDYFVD